MLIIFDVDGTLLGGEAHDWSAFDGALEEVLGFEHTPGFFASLEDVTAESICEAAARVCGRSVCPSISADVRGRYLANLTAAHTADRDAFLPRAGASRLLDHLGSLPGVKVAIATGDWFTTISFKLNCAGLDLSRFPMATAKDARRRADIIKIAASRAGMDLSTAVYVGDGVWDLRACRDLGIPFIGTGARIERLIEGGAEHICEHLEIAQFEEVVRRVTSPAMLREPALLTATSDGDARAAPGVGGTAL